MGRPLKNLIGQQFGELTVLEKDITKQRTYWICQCSCGNIVSVRGDSLVRCKQKSCGCYQNKIKRKENEMLGHTFGQLTVLQLSDKTLKRKDGKAYWDCRCDCGNLVSVSGADLRSGNSTSCGCNNSQGETKISSILKAMNIPFIVQKTFSDLLSDKHYPLRFDFYLPTYNICIEYQGLQHYKPIQYFKGEQGFKQLQNNDNKKKVYCKNHNIKLIEISYKDYDKLSKEYFKNILKCN